MEHQKKVQAHRINYERFDNFPYLVPMQQLKTLRLAFILLSSVLLQHCTRPDRHISPSFYHWKSSFDLGQEDSAQLAKLGVKTLYIHMFDVRLEAGSTAIPVSDVQWKERLPNWVEPIPCVYIVNQVFSTLDKAQRDTLAQQVYKRIKRQLEDGGYTQTPAEIQLDCDWTNKSRDAYFDFLKSFKQQLEPQTKLSVTVRLYQYKHSKQAGVPPADRALLMYYSMDSPKNIEVNNSIIDNAIGSQYLKRTEPYPLPIDLALPSFEWSVLFRRGKFMGLVQGMGLQAVRETGVFEPLKNNIFKATKDTVLFNTFVRPGDILRVEDVGITNLREASVLCRQALNADSMRVSFFDWNPKVIQRIQHENIIEIFDSFR